MKAIKKLTNNEWKDFLSYLKDNEFQSFIFIGMESPDSAYSITAGGAWRSKVQQVGALEVVKHVILHEGE